MQPIKKKIVKESEICEPAREKRIKKPFIIEYKYNRKWRWTKRDSEWHKHSSYKTERDRNNALKSLQKNKASFYEVRIPITNPKESNDL